jgi:hypothetical protein
LPFVPPPTGILPLESPPHPTLPPSLVHTQPLQTKTRSTPTWYPHLHRSSDASHCTGRAFVRNREGQFLPFRTLAMNRGWNAWRRMSGNWPM